MEADVTPPVEDGPSTAADVDFGLHGPACPLPQGARKANSRLKGATLIVTELNKVEL